MTRYHDDRLSGSVLCRYRLTCLPDQVAFDLLGVTTSGLSDLSGNYKGLPSVLVGFFFHAEDR
ncbi:hypothetical protein PILCRDRAFT_820372 [Piloderma croceum F 1598]|uniref:Uncharacterized protein n=1 Tax=Piloderma croceum (strain F 1598) TaxID=765440 RepID=A0A0C3FRY2_PILCF|nr:hypothetical protein PILCRDRAFT_820372 [Piloderma croceum F 1598]